MTGGHTYVKPHRGEASVGMQTAIRTSVRFHVKIVYIEFTLLIIANIAQNELAGCIFE